MVLAFSASIKGTTVIAKINIRMVLNFHCLLPTLILIFGLWSQHHQLPFPLLLEYFAMLSFIFILISPMKFKFWDSWVLKRSRKMLELPGWDEQKHLQSHFSVYMAMGCDDFPSRGILLVRKETQTLNCHKGHCYSSSDTQDDPKKETRWKETNRRACTLLRD